MVPLFRDSFGEGLRINEIDVSADTTEISRCPLDGRLQRIVLTPISIFSDVDFAIRMGELHDAQGVSNVPGAPVVMQVSAAAI